MSYLIGLSIALLMEPLTPPLFDGLIDGTLEHRTAFTQGFPMRMCLYSFRTYSIRAVWRGHLVKQQEVREA